MGKRTYHGAGYVIRDFLDSRDVKTIVAILAVEVGMLLLVTYKGLGRYYLPVTLALMVFTALGCTIAFHFEADRYLLVIVLVLLNLGFMVQQVQAGKSVVIFNFLVKFAIAIVVAFLMAFSYRFCADLLSGDYMILAMMSIQYVICAVMLVAGNTVGGSSEQGAVILLFGITPFELVKFIYIFVAAGLLCKTEKSSLQFWKFSVSREILLIVHTMVLSIFFLLCGELGTLMIVGITGLSVLWMYGERRKLIIALIFVSLEGFLIFWWICDQFLYPEVAANQISLPDVLSRLVKRFGTALHPEKAMSEAGYQGTLGLEAIAIGGWLGIGTERYRLPLPEASNDYVFANVIQTCGLLMGIIMLLFFFALLKRGIEIADRCEDNYFKGIASAITVVIITEAIIHVGYNIALLPITGIPLYFVSQGFTAIVTGMALIAVLLVVSTGSIERTVE